MSGIYQIIMASSSFVQFLLLNGVLSSIFKVSYTATPATTMTANKNLIVSTTLPSLSSYSTLPALNSTAAHLIMSSSERSSTVASTSAVAQHSSSNGISSTVQANNQNSSIETPTVTDAASTNHILDENHNSSSTISNRATISSVTVIPNATTANSPVASPTGSSSLPVAPSNGTTVAVSTSPGNTSITPVTNISVNGENSSVSYLSTSPPTVSHPSNVSTTSYKNTPVNGTSTAPLATTEKQESNVSTSVQVSYSAASVSESGFLSTTGAMPLEPSGRTESSEQSTLFTSASTSSVSYRSTVATIVAAGSTDESSKGWIAAPVIVGVLLIVGIIVAVILIRKRRKAKKEPKYHKRGGQFSNDGVLNPSFHIDADDGERTRPPVVRVQDFVSHVGELHRDSDYGFASEFSLLAKMSQQHAKTAAELPENRTKNRFTNILPFDHSRVRLIPVDDDEDGGSDYINASFLPGFLSRREFIAAQGPMRSTVDDFWRMIWEYNITTIVMVTNLFERGREKCVQYWPEQNDPIYFGEVQVEQISESSLNYYIIRIFSVKSGQQTRRLMQFQFLTWPDFGVPKEPDHLLSFLTQIRNSIPRDANQPILVHCSAGVGRTGTFILIDHVLQLIRHHTEIDVFGLVLDMRNNRPNMVQTEAQYIFAHECIRYAMEHGYHHGKQDFLLTSMDESSTGNPEELYLNVNDRI